MQLGAAATQECWRKTHEIGGRMALDDRQMAALRIWAGDRMREMPHVVARDDVMRVSFAAALEHAARDLLAGRVPG